MRRTEERLQDRRLGTIEDAGSIGRVEADTRLHARRRDEGVERLEAWLPRSARDARDQDGSMPAASATARCERPRSSRTLLRSTSKMRTRSRWRSRAVRRISVVAWRVVHRSWLTARLSRRHAPPCRLTVGHQIPPSWPPSPGFNRLATAPSTNRCPTVTQARRIHRALAWRFVVTWCHAQFGADTSLPDDDRRPTRAARPARTLPPGGGQGPCAAARRPGRRSSLGLAPRPAPERSNAPSHRAAGRPACGSAG